MKLTGQQGRETIEDTKIPNNIAPPPMRARASRLFLLSSGSHLQDDHSSIWENSVHYKQMSGFA